MIESMTHVTTSEMSEPSGPNKQGKISTLSSMVRPTPMTATRTVAVTQEGGRVDAVETVRRLLGPTSTATTMTTPNTTSTTLRMGLTVITATVQSTHTITESRLVPLPCQA